MTALTKTGQPETGLCRGVVLVVEDDDDIRALVARRLRRAGYAVQGVASGEEAAVALADGRQPFAALVIDILLPGIDGWEVARRARAVSASLPIVVASILDQADLPLWLGNATSITKPLAR
ncbi:MAG: response regulator, partial [Actinomycetes bacterium]